MKVREDRYPDQTRMLTPAARVAMIIWGKDNSKQDGSMDFWDALSADRKCRCEMVVQVLLEKHLA